MKPLSMIVLSLLSLNIISCGNDEEKSERFNLLTGVVWQSDSLLINGMDASGPGQQLEQFKGEAVFRADGTGSFGNYTGTWRFAQNETELVISSPALPLPLVTRIETLSSVSLKVTAAFPNPLDPQNPLMLRLTFKPK